MAKKGNSIFRQEIDEKEIAPVSVAINKKIFLAIIERYKVQNPAKYALKKGELERKLDKIG